MPHSTAPTENTTAAAWNTLSTLTCSCNNASPSAAAEIGAIDS